MTEYLTSLLLVSAVTAVLGILPTEEKLRRTVSFALSLTVLGAVLLPLPSLLAGIGDVSGLFSDLEGGIAEGDDWLEGETLAATAEGIRLYLSEEYGIADGDIEVTLDGDLIDGTLILRRITLTVGGRATAADLPRIVRDLREDTGADCEVTYREDR